MGSTPVRTASVLQPTVVGSIAPREPIGADRTYGFRQGLIANPFALAHAVLRGEPEEVIGRNIESLIVGCVASSLTSERQDQVVSGTQEAIRLAVPELAESHLTIDEARPLVAQAMQEGRITSRQAGELVNRLMVWGKLGKLSFEETEAIVDSFRPLDVPLKDKVDDLLKDGKKQIEAMVGPDSPHVQFVREVIERAQLVGTIPLADIIGDEENEKPALDPFFRNLQTLRIFFAIDEHVATLEQLREKSGLDFRSIVGKKMRASEDESVANLLAYYKAKLEEMRKAEDAFIREVLALFRKRKEQTEADEAKTIEEIRLLFQGRPQAEAITEIDEKAAEAAIRKLVQYFAEHRDEIMTRAEQHPESPSSIAGPRRVVLDNGLALNFGIGSQYPAALRDAYRMMLMGAERAEKLMSPHRFEEKWNLLEEREVHRTAAAWKLFDQNYPIVDLVDDPKTKTRVEAFSKALFMRRHDLQALIAEAAEVWRQRQLQEPERVKRDKAILAQKKVEAETDIAKARVAYDLIAAAELERETAEWKQRQAILQAEKQKLSKALAADQITIEEYLEAVETVSGGEAEGLLLAGNVRARNAKKMEAARREHLRVKEAEAREEIRELRLNRDWDEMDNLLRKRLPQEISWKEGRPERADLTAHFRSGICRGAKTVLEMLPHLPEKWRTEFAGAMVSIIREDRNIAQAAKIMALLPEDAVINLAGMEVGTAKKPIDLGLTELEYAAYWWSHLPQEDFDRLFPGQADKAAVWVAEHSDQWKTGDFDAWYEKEMKKRIEVRSQALAGLYAPHSHLHVRVLGLEVSETEVGERLANPDLAGIGLTGTEYLAYCWSRLSLTAFEKIFPNKAAEVSVWLSEQPQEWKEAGLQTWLEQKMKPGAKQQFLGLLTENRDIMLYLLKPALMERVSAIASGLTMGPKVKRDEDKKIIGSRDPVLTGAMVEGTLPSFGAVDFRRSDVSRVTNLAETRRDEAKTYQKKMAPRFFGTVEDEAAVLEKVRADFGAEVSLKDVLERVGLAQELQGENLLGFATERIERLGKEVESFLPSKASEEIASFTRLREWRKVEPLDKSLIGDELDAEIHRRLLAYKKDEDLASGFEDIGSVIKFLELTPEAMLAKVQGTLGAEKLSDSQKQTVLSYIRGKLLQVLMEATESLAGKDFRDLKKGEYQLIVWRNRLLIEYYSLGGQAEQYLVEFDPNKSRFTGAIMPHNDARLPKGFDRAAEGAFVPRTLRD
ncbi:MAG: hypothetical protein ABH823_04440 [bacterium]